LILDLVTETAARLQAAGIRTLDNVRAHAANLVGFSPQRAEQNRSLKRFLRQKLYHHYKVERMRLKAERFLTQLFESYCACPALLPSAYQAKFAEHGRERVICDYLAGMTDRYALDEYKRLFDPYMRV
jgi:dGTPase